MLKTLNTEQDDDNDAWFATRKLLRLQLHVAPYRRVYFFSSSIQGIYSSTQFSIYFLLDLENFVLKNRVQSCTSLHCLLSLPESKQTKAPEIKTTKFNENANSKPIHAASTCAWWFNDSQNVTSARAAEDISLHSWNSAVVRGETTLTRETNKNNSNANKSTCGNVNLFE